MDSLLVTPISKASAMQKVGRSIRLGFSQCFRLYTAYSFQNDLDDNTIPEIQRTGLTNVVLTLNSLCLKNCKLFRFDFMNTPQADAIKNAMELMYNPGALNWHGKLTKVGTQMAKFPLHPML